MPAAKPSRCTLRCFNSIFCDLPLLSRSGETLRAVAPTLAKYLAWRELVAPVVENRTITAIVAYGPLPAIERVLERPSSRVVGTGDDLQVVGGSDGAEVLDVCELCAAVCAKSDFPRPKIFSVSSLDRVVRVKDGREPRRQVCAKCASSGGVNGQTSRRRRRARMKQAPGSHTAAEWIAILRRYGNKCLRCGTTYSISMDHVIPLAKGGSDSADNLQPLCRSCNSSKGTKIIDFRTHSGPPIHDATTSRVQLHI